MEFSRSMARSARGMDLHRAGAGLRTVHNLLLSSTPLPNPPPPPLRMPLAALPLSSPPPPPTRSASSRERCSLPLVWKLAADTRFRPFVRSRGRLARCVRVRPCAEKQSNVVWKLTTDLSAGLVVKSYIAPHQRRTDRARCCRAY